MKKLLSKKLLLAAIMMVAGAANLLADVGDTFITKTKEGVRMTFSVTNEDEKTCQVSTNQDGSACIDKTVTGTVTIPETVMGYTVTGIGSWAFSHCSVSEVEIPQTIVEIGQMAFNECTNLKKCWLPEKLSIVRVALFYGCTNLVDVYIPHQVKTIDNLAFSDCSSLSSVVIPASVRNINSSAFKGCSLLQNIIFLGSECPNFEFDVFYDTYYEEYYGIKYCMANVYTVSRNTSEWMNKLSEQFNNNKEYFYPQTLENCNVIIRDRETLGYMANLRVSKYNELNERYECSYLGTEEQVGSDVTTFTLPEQMLGFDITKLSSLVTGSGSMDYVTKAVVPGTCKTISDFNPYGDTHGFSRLTNLMEVELQEGIEAIEYKAFANTAIKELRLPKSLKTYRFGAVINCNKLTDVYLAGHNVSGSGVWEGIPSHSSATLHVPFANASVYTNFVPDEFAKIEEMEPQDGDIFSYPFKSGHDMMFQIISAADKTCRVYGQDLLTPSIDDKTEGTVNIPNKPLDFKVVELGDYAFTMCKKITFVSIPNTVERIGVWALAGCDEMVSANVPASVKVIDEYAFQSNKKLVNVFLSEGLEKIKAHGFAFCPALETITLPESLTYLGDYGFYGSVLTSIEIPSGVKRIEEYTFQECKQLESVVLNEGLQYIEGSAFNGCESLTSIDLPRSVRKLYKGAFKNCLKLADVKIRNSNIQLVDFWGDPIDNNEAFDLKTDRYAELTVPEGTLDRYNCDPWFLWFNKINYDLPNIPTGISLPTTRTTLPAAWYTLDGQQLQTAPTKPGLYIQNGKKTVVR